MCRVVRVLPRGEDVCAACVFVLEASHVVASWQRGGLLYDTCLATPGNRVSDSQQSIVSQTCEQ